MRSICRTALVALLAVLALGAVASASASAALPEFVLKGTGSGFVYRESPLPVIFQQQNGSGGGVECHGGVTGSGKFISKTEVSYGHMTFTKCRIEGSHACKSAGAKAEEIVTGALKGRLGYLNKAEKSVGLTIEPELKTVHLLFEAECETYGKIAVGESPSAKEFCEKFKVCEGASTVIGTGKPINTSGKILEWHFKCAEGKLGRQEFTKFEGGSTVFLEMEFLGKWERTCLVMAPEIATEAEVEIKA